MASDLGLRSVHMSGTIFGGVLAFSLFWNSTNLFDLFSTDLTDNTFLSHHCVGSARHSTSQQQHYSPQSPQRHRTLLHKLVVPLCHGLPCLANLFPSYSVFFLPYLSMTPGHFAHRLHTYLWTALAFSRDFHMFPYASILLYDLLPPSSSFSLYLYKYCTL